MDAQSLGTASTYLNNLLLARGLLRNGKSIDFALSKKSPGGADATMAKVINLVHDMVLRRDASRLASFGTQTNVTSARSGSKGRHTIYDPEPTRHRVTADTRDRKQIKALHTIV